jgi:hypothetical protein
MKVLRRLFGFLLLVGVVLAGLVVYRRRFASKSERIDLYYEDGSLVSVEQGSVDANGVLPLASDVLRAARS